MKSEGLTLLFFGASQYVGHCRTTAVVTAVPKLWYDCYNSYGTSVTTALVLL